MKNNAKYVEALPEAKKEILKKYEEAGTTAENATETKDEELLAIQAELIRKHVCRIDPFLDDLRRSIESSLKDRTVVDAM